MVLMSPYRSPATASRGTAGSSAVEVVVGERRRRRAPTFSSRYVTRLVPGIGRHVVALGEHPGERELAGRAALLVGELADLVDQREVGVERLALEAREVRRAPGVALVERVRRVMAPVRMPRPSGE